jgi:hypothetical protein
VIENNEDADAMAREGSNDLFFGRESDVPISSCVDRFMIKD